MTSTSGTDEQPNGHEDGGGRSEQQEEIAEVQEQLDDRADGDGLAAEAGAGEETGLAEG